MYNETYISTTPQLPYHSVWRGTSTSDTHVSTPTDRQSAHAGTPTAREQYKRRVGGPKRGSSAGVAITAWRCLS